MKNIVIKILLSIAFMQVIGCASLETYYPHSYCWPVCATDGSSPFQKTEPTPSPQHSATQLPNQ